MGKYTQANRPIRVETALDKDALLLQGFSGEEGVSIPFSFTLDLLSEDPEVDAQSVLRKAATVHVDLPGGGERVIHGLVSRFVQLGRREDLTSYRAEVVPWLWFLSLSSDCRIFQNLSVPEIVEQVFKSQGYSDFDIKCTRSYAPREYCVQYRETHLNFVSRLLEEEGIFYFFEHSTDKHVLILADAPSAMKPCPGLAAARMAVQEGAWQDEDVVLSLEREHAVQTGKVTLRDYDYLQPSLQLEGSEAGSGPEEVYDYPGNFSALDDGRRYARLQLESREAREETVRGDSTCRGLQPGFRFDLREHYRNDANKAYQVLEVRHTASTGDYQAGEQGNTLDYRNTFLAMPHDVPYRPPFTSWKPVVQGSQTALVVGKSGEEIWVDKHGRVKVQFYWDRTGKKDENSSCWVRVATSWAGKSWGFIQIPRIGQEVIVDYLDGDPDKPIITGRVYNAEQTPPYSLPGSQTQSGVKTRSSKGGGTDNFNEIRFEDQKGSEVLYFHAEKDQQVEVENDESVTIGNDRTESVGNNESISIEKDRTESVGGNEAVSVEGNRSLSVSKDESIDVTGNRNDSVGKNEDTSVGENRSHSIGKNDTLSVGKNLGIDAGDSVTVKTGDASITMKKNGDIKIKGKNISLEASGKIQIKASSDVNIKGSKVTSN